MNNTKAQEVFDSFESSFRDKTIIPEELELLWLKKAVGRYSVELDEITFDAAKLDMPELNVVEIESPLPKNFAICLKKLKFKLDAQ